MNWIKKLFSTPTKKKAIHEHSFILQYRTGNAYDGKTEVLKCDCGQWAIRPYGTKEYTHI